jgi:hypothetical protein
MRFKLITVAALLILGGACTSESLTDPAVPRSARKLAGGATNKAKLLYCSAPPRVVVSKLIGPQGGLIQAGAHKFQVPNGSLSASVWITMEVLPVPAAVVDFSPAGLRFNATGRPPRLTLDLKSCAVPPLGGLDIIFITDELDILERLRSDWDSKNKSLSADVRHFSRYAVAF